MTKSAPVYVANPQSALPFVVYILEAMPCLYCQICCITIQQCTAIYTLHGQPAVSSRSATLITCCSAKKQLQRRLCAGQSQALGPSSLPCHWELCGPAGRRTWEHWHCCPPLEAAHCTALHSSLHRYHGVCHDMASAPETETALCGRINLL